MVDKKPTVYDVARDAGVSIATVSRTLRTPEAVRPQTRQSINAAIDRLGYIPSGSARSLAARRTKTIALFLPTIDELGSLTDFQLTTSDEAKTVLDYPHHGVHNHYDALYFDTVLRGCELEAWRQGLSLMVSLGLGYTDEDVVRVVSEVSGKVDGIIVLARSMPDHMLQMLRRRLPLVMIASAPSNHEEEFDLVRVSNRKGMSTLVEHLIDVHHVSRIAYMTGPEDSPDSGKRYEGFCEALTAHGLNPAAAPIYRGLFSQQIAFDIANTLIAQDQLPQALVCANDQMALGVLNALDKAGIKVPERIIVTGFDGITESDISAPRLTTVKQPMLDLGRAAVETLVTRVNNPDSPALSTELPVTVLLRESCEGPLPECPSV